MTDPLVRDKERNPARSKELILDAAERLFAERGFEATSLADVGRAAGLSRATPGYFFGSKADLHRAVLDRCFEEVRVAARAGRDRAIASGETADVILAGAVSDYFDFLAARPNFVKLIQREALNEGPRLGEIHLGLAAGRELVSALSQELGFEDEDRGEVAHMLFSLIALAWSPHIHGETLGRVAGLNPAAPDFLSSRKRHVAELLLGWLAARRSGASLR